MGNFFDAQFFIKKSMIIAAGLCCLIALIFNCVSIATDNWIVSFGNKVDESELIMNVNYGLFRGVKELQVKDFPGPLHYKLSVYCDVGEAICLLSCGKNSAEQEKEFQYLKHNSSEFNCIPDTKNIGLKRSMFLLPSNEEVHGNDEFMNYHLWVSTIVFISFAILCQVVAVAACLLNVIRVPVETWLGPSGIYLANGGAAFWNFVTLCVWGDLFNRNLYYALAIAETILKSWKSSSTSLGYSYWIIFLSMIFNFVSCFFIRFRDMVENHLGKNGNENENIDSSGAIHIY